MTPSDYELPSQLLNLHRHSPPNGGPDIPVPWFVAWGAEPDAGATIELEEVRDGESDVSLQQKPVLEMRVPGSHGAHPQWQMVREAKLHTAIDDDLCWICGQSMTSGHYQEHYRTFQQTPSEFLHQMAMHPPMHRTCADWWMVEAGRAGLLGDELFVLLTIRMTPGYRKALTQPQAHRGRAVWELTNIVPERGTVDWWQAGGEVHPADAYDHLQTAAAAMRAALEKDAEENDVEVDTEQLALIDHCERTALTRVNW